MTVESHGPAGDAGRDAGGEPAGSVLLAEDDDRSRELLTRRLQRRGHEVVAVVDGRDVLAELAKRDFDVVLLDWMMPELSGIDTLAAIREKHDAAHLPVIMLTARDRSEDIVQAFAAGASDYVTKPIDFAVVGMRIRTQVALRRATLALRASEERYALAARGANDGLWDWDLTRQSLYVSPRWREMLGEPVSDLVGRPEIWLDRVHEEDRGLLQVALDAHLQGSSSHFECEHRMRASDGGHVWVLVRGMAVRDAAGVPIRIAGSQTDVTARREAEERLRRDATHDPLTGLCNRKQLLEELATQVAVATRHDHALSLAFCDMDYFKQINDTHGHTAGDAALRGFAEVLRRCLRVGDIAGRYGGDEFCIVFPNTDAARAVLVTERIRRSLAVAAFVAPGGGHFRASATFGVAELAGCAPEVDALIERADAALYKAKDLGRNRSYPAPAG
jgi:diguanylate cyclase (GGDEF)-like protein/PAS domain S-box-containing protein